MTETRSAPAPLPMTRPADSLFDPPPELTRLREHEPLSRMSYPDGHVGWLATNYALVREVLADPRFSSRLELLHNPFPGQGHKLPPAPPGHFQAIDPPEHTRYRRLLTGKFTVRRMRLLADRIERITAEHLDAMARKGPPIDLIEAYAYPVPALTICELLGVPAADHDRFQAEARIANSLDARPDQMYAAAMSLDRYMRELVAAKRAAPTDDLLSDLTTTDLTDEELAGVGSLLLGAGLDTVANMIGLGVYALLQHPGQLAALRDEPDLAEGAVEELMRYLSLFHTNAKTALEDVELAGHCVRAGDTVTLSHHAANRDPDRFPDPDTLDLRRRAIGHVSFGHGVHQCIGQQLARVEMRIAYRALLARFPSLRLAAEPGDVTVSTSIIYSAATLPVTWDEG
jgi:cytochrome P450